MQDNRIDRLIYRLMSGKTIYQLNDKEIIFIPPTLELLGRAEFFWHKVVCENRFQGWPSRDDAENILTELGIWSPQKEHRIKFVTEQITEIKEVMYQNFCNGHPYELLRKRLRQAEQELVELLNDKCYLDNLTLEGFADTLKSEFIVRHCIRCKHKLSWLDFRYLIGKIREEQITPEEYRIIARNSTWMSYWALKKTQVFKNPSHTLTVEQRNMSAISSMYDNAYKNHERPDEKVFDDPDLFDGWLSITRQKEKSSQLKSEIDKKVPSNAQQVFVLTNEQKTVDKIHKLNSPAALARMKEMGNGRKKAVSK